MIASKKSLRILAGIIWITGGVILAVKGGSLLLAADVLRPELRWTWLAIPAGLAIGSIKMLLIFDKACRRNLARIADLARPRLWLAYRPGFYIALALMIVAGGSMSRLAQGSYGGLLAVAILDLSLATGLLGSSRLFRTVGQE